MTSQVELWKRGSRTAWQKGLEDNGSYERRRQQAVGWLPSKERKKKSCAVIVALQPVSLQISPSIRQNSQIANPSETGPLVFFLIWFCLQHTHQRNILHNLHNLCLLISITELLLFCFSTVMSVSASGNCEMQKWPKIFKQYSAIQAV